MKIALAELRNHIRKIMSEITEDEVMKLGRQFTSGDHSLAPVLYDALEEVYGHVSACAELVIWAIATTGIPVDSAPEIAGNEATFGLPAPPGEEYLEHYPDQVMEGLMTLKDFGMKVRKWDDSVSFTCSHFSGNIDFSPDREIIVTIIVNARDDE